MPRKAEELGAKAVSNISAPGLHAVGGVSGLYLQVLPTGGRSWVLRAAIAGRRRDMGLGGFPDVPLADARRKAREAREAIDRGEDPIRKRREAKARLLATASVATTFRQAAKDYMASQEAAWRNAKHREQWRNTLAEAYPVIGDMAPPDIEVGHVLSVLKPIWHSRTETASRLRQRIESVLSYCRSLDAAGAAQAFPPHWQNPARWKDHLSNLLPAPASIKKHGKMAALPFDEIGGFMQRLRSLGGTGALALEFTILTAARSGETRGACWSEIDLAAKLWTVPAERMKEGREHRVPLSAAAVAVLEKTPRFAGSDLVFPSSRGGPVSDRTLLAVVRRMGLDVTVHGFRSTFRDWAGDRTNFSSDVAEAALSHAVGDKVERTYRRGDALEKRRRLMDAWAGFCAAAPVKNGSNVAAFGRVNRAAG